MIVRTNHHAQPVPRRRRGLLGRAWRLLSRFVPPCVVVLSRTEVCGALQTDADKVSEASEAITSLDLERATELLRDVHSEGPKASFERARLALYRGDCDSARAILSAPTFGDRKEPELLLKVATACAGALSEAAEVRAEPQGVLIRVQDDQDNVLAPFITAVALKAREAMQRELGVVLPKPLRIDLVRDNFSLSAVTGLPLSATETTGTVAVARWGRVAMISPRAAPEGYPWQDTLAHEIVHLAVTQASGDQAPLWLQEGLAKLNETTWRGHRPFDGSPDPDRVAAQALASGTSVGIDSIGPSVAMLPSPEQASIAYSEVESFTRFWIARNGRPALELLLRDARGLGAATIDPAMVSVTGYPLKTWIERWRENLQTLPRSEEGIEPRWQQADASVAKAVRMGELLAARHHDSAAALEFEAADSECPDHPAIRWRLARSHYLAGSPDLARERLGSLEDLPGLHAGWLAMHATLSGELIGLDAGTQERQLEQYATAVGLHPYLEDAACRGAIARNREPGSEAPDSSAAAGYAVSSSLPRAPPSVTTSPFATADGAETDIVRGEGVGAYAWDRLCGAARQFPSD